MEPASWASARRAPEVAHFCINCHRCHGGCSICRRCACTDAELDAALQQRYVQFWSELIPLITPNQAIDDEPQKPETD